MWKRKDDREVTFSILPSKFIMFENIIKISSSSSIFSSLYWGAAEKGERLLLEGDEKSLASGSPLLFGDFIESSCSILEDEKCGIGSPE